MSTHPRIWLCSAVRVAGVTENCVSTLGSSKTIESAKHWMISKKLSSYHVDISMDPKTAFQDWIQYTFLNVMILLTFHRTYFLIFKCTFLNTWNNFCHQGITLLTLEKFILLCEMTYSLDFVNWGEAEFATPKYASMAYWLF